MEEYNITIFRQSRALFCLFLFPLLLILAIFLGARINSFIIPVVIIITYFFLNYYFIVGNLKIIIKNDNELFFEWKKKLIFNYKQLSPLKIADIKVIVLDNNEFLRKIKTDNITIHINNSKIKPKDSEKFISRLLKYDNIRVIDSWDELTEKGYIKVAYLINSLMLIIAIIVFIIFTILKGFNPTSLSILLLFIPQMILYREQMKNKVNNK